MITDKRTGTVHEGGSPEKTQTAGAQRPGHTREARDVAGPGRRGGRSGDSRAGKHARPRRPPSSAFTRGHERACPHEDLCTGLSANN